AAGEAGDGRTMRPVDLEDDEIVAPHAHAPGRIDLRDGAALELEGGVGGVLGVAAIGLAALVGPLADVDGAETAYRLHSAEQAVEHIAPVAEHVEDDAAAVGPAVVPARPLRRLPGPLEHEVAELAADGEDAAEKADIDQPVEFSEARQIELVLDDAGLDTAAG